MNSLRNTPWQVALAAVLCAGSTGAGPLQVPATGPQGSGAAGVQAPGVPDAQGAQGAQGTQGAPGAPEPKPIPVTLADPLALVGGLVHLGDGADPEPATILLDKGLITAVGAGLEVPEGWRQIDVTGRHIAPGLIDGLAYHDPLHDLLYTAAGVTTLRDQGNDLARVLSSAHPEARRLAEGPSISTAGAVLDGSPPSTGAALVLRDAHEARHRTGALIDEGVDFLSVQVNLGAEAFGEVLSVAGERGLQVWGPVPAAVPLETVLAAGAAGQFSGMLFMDRLLPQGRAWPEVTDAEIDSIVTRVAAGRFAIVPLLSGTARLTEDPFAAVGGEPHELLLVGPEHAGHWRTEFGMREGNLGNDAWRQRAAAVLERQRALVLALHRAGVPIVPGSGAPHPWLVPGTGLHKELAQLEAAGIPAAEVFHLATSGAADAMGMMDRGRIEVGRRADLLVLAGDPRASLATLSEIDTVVLAGWPLEWVELDQRMAELEVRLAELRTWLEAPLDVSTPELPEGPVIMSGLAETSSVAGRLARERFAVVKEYDGSLSFVGRRATRTGAGEVIVEVSQRVREGKLEAFGVKLLNDGHEVSVLGLTVAGQIRVERRVDGQHLGTFKVAEQLVAIDAGSATTAMVLGQIGAAGPMPILRFDEALELEVVRWDLVVNDQGDHVMKVPAGLKLASYETTGAPRVIVDQTGSGAITTQILELDTLGGPGLGLPADKLALVEARIRAAEAAAPARAQPSAGQDPGGAGAGAEEGN